MVEGPFRAEEGRSEIIIPIEHQYFQIGIFAHGVCQVDPGIGRYRETRSSVGRMGPVPLETFRAIGRYMVGKRLTYLQLRIKIIHEGSDIGRTDLRALRIIVGELA